MRRVVVTGLGMVSPLGCGVEISWQNLIAGQSGIRRTEGFPIDDLASQVAAQIPRGQASDGKFNPDEWMEPKESRKVDPFTCPASKKRRSSCAIAAPGASARSSFPAG
jgi:3-oxoacyl-[acyl-carrier-protein] synthase II